MKIAVFVPSLQGGGAERAMLTLANGMAAKGLAVDLVLTQATGAYLKDVAGGVRVVDLGGRRVFTSLPRLVAYLRRTQREPSHEAALTRMPMPVLLFAGEHDTDRLDNSTVAATRQPDATLAIIPGENHASTIVRADKVLPHVMRFLARVTGEEAKAA